VKARWATEFTLQNSSKMPLSQAYAVVHQLGSYIRDNRYIQADDLEIVMNEKGLSVDYRNSIYSKLGDDVPKEMDRIKANNIKCAEDIFRLLIIACNGNIKNDPVVNSTGLPYEKAILDGLLPSQINISAPLEQAILEGDRAKVWELLGWTGEAGNIRTYGSPPRPMPTEQPVASASPLPRSGSRVRSSSPAPVFSKG